MGIQKIDVNEVKITSKLLDLWLRPHSFYVTRILHTDMHRHLLVFLIKGEKLTPVTPSRIKVLRNSALFEAEGVSGKISSQGDNSVSIQVSCDSGRVGVMWPSCGDCYFADEMYPINQKFTYRAKSDASDDPTITRLHFPLVSQVTPECCLTAISRAPVELNSFNHNFFPHLNAIADRSLSIVFRSFLSRRESLADYQRRFGFTERIYEENFSLDTMKHMLYHNAGMISTFNPNLLKEVKAIQKTLKENKIASCVIGSLAMRLHGLSHSAQDADFVVDSLSLSKKTFEEEYSSSESEKWAQCAIRLSRDRLQFDLIELLDFPYDEIEEIDGIDVLSVNGLLHMKLLGEYERSIIEPNYDAMLRRNHHSINNLITTDTKLMYPFFHKFLTKHSSNNFHSLISLLRGATWDPVELQVNAPFVVNAYRKEKETLIPIINDGSRQPAKILINRPIKTAQYHEIGENPIACEVRENSITSPPIESFGIVICND